MTEKLKPCPFCGGKARLFFIEETGFWDVQCQDCGAMPYLRKKDYEAVKAWNERHERTCSVKQSFHGTNGSWHFLTCGHRADTWLEDPPSFCPTCGAKVVWQ